MAALDKERAAVDEVFGLLGSLTETEAVVRMTNTTPLLISVLDVIQGVKGGSLGSTRAVWTNLKNSHPEVEGKISYHRFEGSRGRETPVAEINNILYIIFRVPGDAARRFAEGSASIVTRFLGGSKSMQAEIAANREIQEHLAREDPTNPLRAFGAHVERTEPPVPDRAVTDADDWRVQRVEGLVSHHELGDIMKSKRFPQSSHWRLQTRQNQTVLNFTETTTQFKHAHGVPKEEPLPDHMSRSQLAARRFMSDLVMSSAKNTNPTTAAQFQKIVDGVSDLVAVTLKGSHFYESNPFVAGNRRTKYGVSTAQTAKAAAEIKAADAVKLIAAPIQTKKRLAGTTTRASNKRITRGSDVSIHA